MLRAHVDSDGALTAVNGYAAPDLDLSTDAAAQRPQPAASGRLREGRPAAADGGDGRRDAA